MEETKEMSDVHQNSHCAECGEYGQENCTCKQYNGICNFCLDELASCECGGEPHLI